MRDGLYKGGQLNDDQQSTSNRIQERSDPRKHLSTPPTTKDCARDVTKQF